MQLRGQCGANFVGSPRSGPSGHYYRCGSQLGSLYPEPERRCRARTLDAAWLERLVWEDCRDFIRNPGAALAEAQQQLRERLSRSAELEGERRRLQRLLAEKEAERERVMTLFRRGRATLTDVEGQLDVVGHEAAELRMQLDALRAQHDLAEAFEAHYAEAGALLARLHDRLDDIERNDDWATKRQVVELLVAGVRVDTTGTGREKRATLTLSYSFAGGRVVEATNNSYERSRCMD